MPRHDEIHHPLTDTGQDEVGCIVLGHGADELKVMHWAASLIARRYPEWMAVFERAHAHAGAA